MSTRPRLFADKLPRPALVRAATGFAFAVSALLAVAPAHAALLPSGFFDMKVTPGQGSAAVEADMLSYNANTGVITASGDVLLAYQGQKIRADRLEFNQVTGELRASGSVVVTDEAGNVFEMDTVEVSGGMKTAVLASLTITTTEGAVVTADSVEYQDALATVLNEATYSPCGLCVDSKGRKIGWRVKSARMIYDREKASVILEGPSLELLGVPVAWLPWMWIPDPTQPRAQGMRMPSFDLSEERGLEATVPFFLPVTNDIDLLLSGTLMTRQGFRPQAELTWRIPEFSGVIEVKASGLYQLNPSEFAKGKIGNRDWRGAIQTAGRFVPTKEWTLGWTYSVFSDNAYLTDYELSDADSNVNQVYATHLTRQTWLDARIQRFNRLGNYSDDDQQGLNLPKVEFEHVQDLAPGMGRIHLNGEILGVARGADQTAPVGGIDYVLGNEGTKLHGMIEGAWENQYILPGGLAATPYLGLRVDGATYDRSAAALFSATPIAALDIRWPLIAQNGASTHLVEPIAQIVYRGSDTTKVGITNDDAHSFVFDTSNLFSYNRFSGIDRQETGLRANVGVHYLGNFDDGSWLDLVAGQSFQLAGVNAYGIGDEAQVGTSTGLGGTDSFIVASARGGTAWGLSGSAKMQLDPSSMSVTRGGVGVNFAPTGQWYTLGADYFYLAANPALGVLNDVHEITGRGSLQLNDYYTVSGSLAWDINANAWTKARSGLVYDDGYLRVGGGLYATPSSWGIDFTTFNLKDPLGLTF